MADDTNGPDEAEIEALARQLRPSLARTVLTVLGIVAVVLGSIAAVIALLFSEGQRLAVPHPDAGAPADADRGQLVVINDLDWDVRADPASFAVADQTVTITADVPGAPDAHTFGTGFVITDGLIVSAAHIVIDAPEGVSVPVRVNCGGLDTDGGLLAYDATRDVMAIFAPACRGRDLAFETRPLAVDDVLQVAGYMFALNAGTAYRFHRYTSYVPGAVLRPEEATTEADLMARIIEMRRLRIPRYRAIAGAAIPGNSGSPVYDARGRIVGMLVIRDTRHDRSYIVPARTILRVLQANGLP